MIRENENSSESWSRQSESDRITAFWGAIVDCLIRLKRPDRGNRPNDGVATELKAEASPRNGVHHSRSILENLNCAP